MFHDRTEAGRALADALRKYIGKPDLIVLGLPRGGVPVAFEVAQALRTPLDVLLVRKLGVPGNEELGMGAIAEDGLTIVDQDLVRRLGIKEDAVRLVIMHEQVELERRERVYSEERPKLDLRGKNVIVVDDGVAGGSSMYAAVHALRKREVASIIIAVPVGAADTIERLARMVDKIVCLVMPSALESVGKWYEDFSQTGDDEVRALLRQSAGKAAFA